MPNPLVDTLLSSLSTPSPQLTAEQEAQILEPYTYLTSSPGKGVCTQLIQALNHWLQVPPALVEPITRVTETLHDAALLVDDIEDESDLRRGRPVAHNVYGVPMTINAANYAAFLAYQEVSNIPYLAQSEPLHTTLSRSNADLGFRLVQIVNDEMLALHRGQGRELYWRTHHQCPTEEAYIEMARNKTAGFLRIAVRLMSECATSNRDVNYVPLVELLGIWFQIRDDYMNLYSSTYTKKKGFADDLSEGKFSFPIIHGIREKPQDTYVLDILQQRPKDPELKRQVITYLAQVTHSFEYTLDVLSSLEAQARAEAERLGGNSKLGAILDYLHV